MEPRTPTVTVLPSLSIEEARAAAGYHPHGTWYTPRRQRSEAFRRLANKPLPTSRDVNPEDEA